ncbi:MAG: methyltransferase domain-containing protein [Candidatus Andeanibacterium colombiense]|uniref:Methyltransferase domain-containing protein n=1 Tax=Candidatus Andeanibacterium colombiense TaxID=3121345 RepID=A0AAJ6BNQ4_9SPHN|nr:MAG: methyltransferase domain-containing protein [Sphingomonadaceae bacterium]
MTKANDWEGRTGESWAAEWRRTDRSWSGLTEQLLGRTRDFTFSSVLDIGCGAGELSLAIARGRPTARVIGLDISAPLVEAARERGRNLTNAAFDTGDAARWIPPEDFAPDLLVSRHGVMFFDDPAGAFAHLAQIAAPGAGLLFSCFRGPTENEFFTGPGSLLPRPATPRDPHAPGPMAFADPERVRGILAQAGWHAADFAPVDFAMVVGAGENALDDALAYFASIGPLAAAAAELTPAERDDLFVRLRAWLAPRQVDDLVALGAAAWIVTARRG